MRIINNTAYVVSLLEKEPVTTLIYGYNDKICYVMLIIETSKPVKRNAKITEHDYRQVHRHSRYIYQIGFCDYFIRSFIKGYIILFLYIVIMTFVISSFQTQYFWNVNRTKTEWFTIEKLKFAQFCATYDSTLYTKQGFYTSILRCSI